MFLSSRLPNRLPPPIQHSNESGFSEGAARALLTHLSGDIGVREQGMTTNEIDTPNFLVETIQSMQAVAQKNGDRLGRPRLLLRAYAVHKRVQQPNERGRESLP